MPEEGLRTGVAGRVEVLRASGPRTRRSGSIELNTRGYFINDSGSSSSSNSRKQQNQCRTARKDLLPIAAVVPLTGSRMVASPAAGRLGAAGIDSLDALWWPSHKTLWELLDEVNCSQVPHSLLVRHNPNARCLLAPRCGRELPSWLAVQ